MSRAGRRESLPQMPTIEPILDHTVPFLLVVFRLGGLFLFTPLLSNRTFPRRFRLMVAVMLAGAVYAGLPAVARVAPQADLPALPGLVFGEVLIGAAIGLVAAIPVLSLELAGSLIGTQIGFGLARVYNPEADAESDVLGQLLMYLAIAAFVAAGGLEALFGVLIGTFDRVPPGGFAAGQVPLDVLVGVITSGFELALRVAAPAMCIVFLVLIAMGFVSKTMPQINVMSVGFSVKIMVALALLAASLTVVAQVADEEMGRVVRLIGGWTQSL